VRSGAEAGAPPEDSQASRHRTRVRSLRVQDDGHALEWLSRVGAGGVVLGLGAYRCVVSVGVIPPEIHLGSIPGVSRSCCGSRSSSPVYATSTSSLLVGNVVRPGRFELPTYRFVVCCSIQLS
jgi:hypothetical protein